MKPLLRIGTKEFLSGISLLGAHAGNGLFYKADGATPLFDAGKSQANQNGLLMAGAGGTAVGGTVTGTVMNMIPDNGIYYSEGGYIAVTSDKKIWKQGFSSGLPTGSIGSVRTVTPTLLPGLAILASALLYRQTTHIGKYASSTYTDDWLAVDTEYFGAMHVYFDTVLFGNGYGKLGRIYSDLSSSLSALDFDGKKQVSAISDDGVYAIIAITANILGSSVSMQGSEILFWDGSAPSWIRSHTISDPIIYRIEKTPVGTFAFGVTGIWQVTLEGVTKVFSTPPGVYLASGTTSLHYGYATSYFSDALLWGGVSGSVNVLKSMGRLDGGAPNAYLTPILLTPTVNITAVNGQLSKGYVYVADSTPQIKYYPVGSGTPQTSVSAQTVYFQLPTKYEINHIEVIFGEPLASGDSVSIQLKTDEDTAVTPTTALAATYADDGAIRRKRVKLLNFFAEDQLSLVITFVGGAVKIKRIDVFGSPIPV